MATADDPCCCWIMMVKRRGDGRRGRVPGVAARVRSRLIKFVLNTSSSSTTSNDVAYSRPSPPGLSEFHSGTVGRWISGKSIEVIASLRRNQRTHRKGSISRPDLSHCPSPWIVFRDGRHRIASLREVRPRPHSVPSHKHSQAPIKVPYPAHST
jgi:hypothetical protein